MSLVDRWEENRVSDLRRALREDGCNSPFGQTDEGLCDFRGVVINESLHQLTITSVDFSEARMDSGQFAATVKRCRFTKCKFESNVGNEFIECDFGAANLANCVFRGKFVECDFSAANLTNVRGSHVRFEDCNFDGANLRKASFYDSTFVRCKITNCKFGSGSLAGSKFEDCEIEADFTKTVMQRVVGIEGDKI